MNSPKDNTPDSNSNKQSSKESNSKNQSLKQILIKSAMSLYNSTPILIAIILFIGLATTAISKKYYSSLFSENVFVDPIIGDILGSILAGNPVTSYILGGEFLKQGIGLITVTAFIVAWVTVGIIQYPAEALLLGNKFAFYRNISAFVLAIFVAIATVLVVDLI